MYVSQSPTPNVLVVWGGAGKKGVLASAQRASHTLIIIELKQKIYSGTLWVARGSTVIVTAIWHIQTRTSRKSARRWPPSWDQNQLLKSAIRMYEAGRAAQTSKKMLHNRVEILGVSRSRWSGHDRLTMSDGAHGKMFRPKWSTAPCWCCHDDDAN